MTISLRAALSESQFLLVAAETWRARGVPDVADALLAAGYAIEVWALENPEFREEVEAIRSTPAE